MSTLDKLAEHRPRPWRPTCRPGRRGLRRVVVALAVSSALLLGVTPVVAEQRSDDLVGSAAAEDRGVETRELPDVSMASGVLLTSNGQVLWARRPDQQRAMASITKVMTALVALEESNLSDEVTVTKRSAEPGESVAGLTAGETLPMSSLLEALLVKSGNDAAVVVAQHVGGSEEAFVDLMNEKAAELGLSETHFANPHGLDEEGHHSSARDLSVLVREAMKNPEFRRIVALEDVSVDGNTFENSNELIGSYSGATGVKTGWTNDAGYSLAASATRGEVSLVAIVLGTKSEAARFQDARVLLDWGFEHYSPTLLAAAGDYEGRVPVEDFLDVEVGAVIAEETSAAVFDLEGEVEEVVELVEGVDAPVERGEPIGTVTYRQGEREVASAELVASRDIAAPGMLARIGIAATRMWRAVFGEPEPAVGVPSPS